MFTVKYLGWKGARNGLPLARAASDGFDAIVTTDWGMEHPHNPAALPLSVVLLHAESNGIKHLRPLVPSLLVAMRTLPPRAFVHVRIAP